MTSIRRDFIESELILQDEKSEGSLVTAIIK